MMEKGLLDECIKLKGKWGIILSMQSMQGIGYKEILYVLRRKYFFKRSCRYDKTRL